LGGINKVKRQPFLRVSKERGRVGKSRKSCGFRRKQGEKGAVSMVLKPMGEKRGSSKFPVGPGGKKDPVLSKEKELSTGRKVGGPKKGREIEKWKIGGIGWGWGTWQ